MSEFRTEMKSGSGFVQELCLFVPAGCEELVALVDGGELRLVHDRVLLDEAEPTGVGGGVEGGQDGKLPPAEAVVSPLVLQAPDVPSQAGVDPFARVAEGMGVVPISDLPGGGRYAGVGGVWLADLVDRGPVQGVGVLAPGPLHRAVLRPSPAVAVRVSGQLLLKPLVLTEHLVVVGCNDLCKVGHGPIGELHCVAVEGAVD